MGVVPWSGSRIAELTALVLSVKGTTCHLCGLPGASSSDHDPPRCELIDLHVPDPDALVYLFPSHVECNRRRGARAITPALRAELRRRRLDHVAASTSPRFLTAATRPEGASAAISPRFAKNRPKEGTPNG